MRSDPGEKVIALFRMYRRLCESGLQPRTGFPTTGIPSRTVSVLEGLRTEFPKTEIKYLPGTQFLRNDGSAVPNDLFTTDEGKPGLKVEYGLVPTTLSIDLKPIPIVTQVSQGVDLRQDDLPKDLQGKGAPAVHWSGYLTPNRTGDYLLGILADGYARVTVNGSEIAQEFTLGGPESRLGRVHLEQGKKVSLNVIYAQLSGSKARAQLIWAKAESSPSPEAVAVAKQADVVVAVVGITSQLEGEEMKVSEEGFLGGDRTSLDLPRPEEALLEEVAETGKPLVVVLMNGSALGVNWANAHANAILDAWYSGEEGGAAVAETFSSKNNPAGRLPVTFYADVSQLPNFEDSMKGRTYRYFEGKPLYPFGYGLSYSAFSYSGLTLPTEAVKAGDSVKASLTVANTGSRPGDEVVQLYLSFPDVKGAPLKALRGFRRVHLEPGASERVDFDLKGRDLGIVTELASR